MARRKESPQEAVVREMMRGYGIPYEGALREIYFSALEGVL